MRTRSHPHGYYIRFNEEEDQRLVKMIRAKRLRSVQAFGHAAIMRALNEAELGKKTADEIAKEERAEKAKQRIEPARGLGIRDRLVEGRERDDEEAERAARIRERERTAPATSAPLPSLTTASPNEDIVAFARMIVDASPSERDTVKRSVLRALRRQCSTEMELERLVEDLNATAKRLAGTPMTALERARERASR